MRMLALVMLMLTGVMFAQSSPDRNNYTWSNVATAAPTTYIDLTADANKVSYISDAMTFSTDVASGTPASCTFVVEGSQDKTNFYALTTSQSCMSANMFHVTDRPVPYLRINVTALTGGAKINFHWTGVAR